MTASTPTTKAGRPKAKLDELLYATFRAVVPGIGKRHGRDKDLAIARHNVPLLLSFGNFTSQELTADVAGILPPCGGIVRGRQLLAFQLRVASLCPLRPTKCPPHLNDRAHQKYQRHHDGGQHERKGENGQPDRGALLGIRCDTSQPLHDKHQRDVGDRCGQKQHNPTHMTTHVPILTRLPTAVGGRAESVDNLATRREVAPSVGSGCRCRCEGPAPGGRATPALQSQFVPRKGAHNGTNCARKAELGHATARSATGKGGTSADNGTKCDRKAESGGLVDEFGLDHVVGVIRAGAGRLLTGEHEAGAGGVDIYPHRVAVLDSA